MSFFETKKKNERKVIKKKGIVWKLRENIVYLQRERRDQVEPRCAERWHLCDDEQFDLAACFPSLS